MSILIIGSGFAGLCMGIRLKKAGIHDFTILERNDAIGGTWLVNDYPGCACDVQSHLYSFSFEPNPDWSRMFAPQGEIRAYLERCFDKYGVRAHVRLKQNVIESRYDEQTQSWTVRTEAGETHRGRVLIAAIGGLSNPAYPTIKGLETFKGTKFHSAHWNHDYDLAGKRVAVIGTGASAIQFVPQIAPKVAQLHLFQRTAPWVMKKPDRPISGFERFMFKHLPATQRFWRRSIYWACEARVLALVKNPKVMEAAKNMTLRYLREEVKDKALRDKLTPSYAVGCKRILLTDDYYPALQRPNVNVVTDGIKEVREHSIVTADGQEHAVDAIIFGTGFTAQSPVPRGLIAGRGGIDLRDAWKDAPEAYKGTAMAGYPNFFFLVGPNTGLGHSSMVYMIEAAATYVLDAIEQMRRDSWGSFEVKPEKLAAYNDKLQRKIEGTVWQVGGCKSWYMNDAGRNTALWPDYTFRFRKETEHFEAADYTIEPAATVAPKRIPAALPSEAVSAAHSVN